MYTCVRHCAVVPESQLGMGENAQPRVDPVMPAAAAAAAAGLGADMMTTIIEAGPGAGAL